MGRLTFAYSLLNQAEPERTYAIVHELLHMRYPRHNRMFTNMMIAYLGRKGIDLKNLKLR